jgi:hypothetical protein
MSNEKQDAKKKQDKEYGTYSDVPDGMTTRLGLNGQAVLVPQYLLPGMDHAFAAFRQKAQLEVTKAKPEVSQFIRAAPPVPPVPVIPGTVTRIPARHCHTFSTVFICAYL